MSHSTDDLLAYFLQEELFGGDPFPLLDRLRYGTQLIERLESVRSQLVERARYDGASWDQIADATGMRSRQAAHHRWS